VSIPGGEGELAGTEVPQGATPDLRGIPDSQRFDPSTGEAEYTSPSLNMDGDWVRFEQRMRDEYAFSIFHNRFRRVRSPGRDDHHREEVARGEPHTRALGDGTCITTQDVTYETRKTEGWVLYQYYEFFRVDVWVEGYYEAADDPRTSLGAAYGTAATTPVLTASAGVGVAQAVAVAGGVFIGTTQAMSELKGAATKVSSGWWPIMWYSSPASEQYDTERQVVNETISVHPCDRPLTGSPADDDHNLLTNPGGTTTADGQGLGSSDDDAPLADLPSNEGELPYDPDSSAAPEDMDLSGLDEVKRPDFRGDGDHRRDPDHNQEDDWYRDLGRRGGYFFVAQYLNQFREVRDSQFDTVEEDRFDTGEIGRKALGDGMCVDVRKFGIVTFDRYAVRVDIAYKIWRVDSEEALHELKSSRYGASWLGPSMAEEAARAQGTSSTASATAGAAGAAAGAAKDVAETAGKPLSEAAGTGLTAAGHVLGGVSTTITVASMESAVQVGAGWSPVGYFFGAAEMRHGEEFRWVQEGEPYPCHGGGASAGDDGLHDVRLDGLTLELNDVSNLVAAGTKGGSGPVFDQTNDDGSTRPGLLRKLIFGVAITAAAGGAAVGGVAVFGGSDEPAIGETVVAAGDQPTGGEVVTPGEDNTAEPSEDGQDPVADEPLDGGEANPDSPTETDQGDDAAGTVDVDEEATPVVTPPSPEQSRFDEVGLEFGLAPGSLGYMPDSGLDGIGSQKGQVWTIFPGMKLTGFGATVALNDPNDALAVWDNSAYPCGAMTVTFVVTCPTGAGPMGPGEVIVVAMHLDSVGGLADTTYTYGLAFDDDGDSADNYPVFPPFDFDLFLGTEIWYRLQIDPDGTRRMWADAWNGNAIVPRYSTAAVVERGDILIWVIPRTEVPGDAVGYRGTAFADQGDGPIPDSSSAGADVTGIDPESDLTPIDLTVVVDVELGDTVPPDFGEAPIARQAPTGDPTAHLAASLASEFVERAQAALDSGNEERVLELLHPGLIGQFGRETCLNFVRATIGQAIGYQVTGDAVLTVTPGFVFIQVPSLYSYPTGDVPSNDALVPTNDGRLGLFFDCTSAG